MGLTVEKRPMNGMESYFVFKHGDKIIEAPVNAVKSAVLTWVFLIVAVFCFMIGQNIQQNNYMMTAYMLNGNLTNENGTAVFCNAVLTPQKMVKWNCYSGNETNSTTV